MVHWDHAVPITLFAAALELRATTGVSRRVIMRAVQATIFLALTACGAATASSDPPFTMAEVEHDVSTVLNGLATGLSVNPSAS